MHEMQCDVLVSGSGVSGVAAAVSAAERGARVIILERDGFIGGLASGAWVGTVCGAARCLVDSYEPILRGWPAALTESLTIRSKSSPQRTKEGLWYIPYDPVEMRLLLSHELVRFGVTVMLHSTLTELRTDGPRVASCRVQTSDEQLHIECGAVVDCTGESIASLLLGLAVIESDSYQTPSLVLRVENVPFASEAELRMTLLHDIRLAVTAGGLAQEFDFLSVVPGSLRDGAALLKFTLRSRRRSGAPEVSRLSLEGVALADRFRTWLVESGGPLATLRLSAVAPSLGIRTGRRLVGRHILRGQDVIACTRGAEDVAFGSWPLEEWNGEREPMMTHLPAGATYAIPASCLESAHIHNLFAGGRCISADDGAIASARVIGTALQTGWGAGALAASSALGHGRSETIAALAQN